MSIIKTHEITLYGGSEQYQIVLRPLSDAYLPYLYKWNSDPDVLYWTEGDDVKAYPPEVVHQIYGEISQNNLCFIIEVNGKIIGEVHWQQPGILQALQQTLHFCLYLETVKRLGIEQNRSYLESCIWI